jgi:hypothetical protein
VAEHWDGFDESGTIYVPDFTDFVVAIAVTPLPENSVITYGNRERRFVDTIATRTGKSEIIAPASPHAHHRGLQTLDDLSPSLKLEATHLQWSAADRAWIADGSALDLSFVPTGPGAERFITQPGTIYTFVNQAEESRVKAGPVISMSSIPSGRLKPGLNVITINWVSDWGAVAANSLRVIVKPGGTAARSETGR